MGLVHSRKSSVGKMSAIPTKCVARRTSFVVGETTSDLRGHLRCGYHIQEFTTIEQRDMTLAQTAEVTTDKRKETTEAKKDANRLKNRYSFVVPFDATRVKLQVSDDMHEQSDYINANFIQGEDINFIATQGPLPHTFADFWRMVWETQTGIIVMLTKEKEGQRIKCDKYWPEEGDAPEMFRHGNLELELLSREEDNHLQLITRTYKITNRKQQTVTTPTFTPAENNPTTTEERIVTQLQFLGWPDHGVPEQPASIIELVKRVEETRKKRQQEQQNQTQPQPVIVHCSAGIGRTGAFLAVHIQLTKWNKHKHNIVNSEQEKGKEVQQVAQFKFDIYNTVVELRRQRIGMVQQPEQYRLIYETLLLESEKLS